MASTQFKITKNNFPKVRRMSPQLADDGVHAVATEGERILKDSIRATDKQSNGRSVPGSPPAIDTGALINSINVRKPALLRRHVRSGVDYHQHLEYGTKHIAARPSMQPMAHELSQSALDIVADVFSKIEDV